MAAEASTSITKAAKSEKDWKKLLNNARTTIMLLSVNLLIGLASYKGRTVLLTCISAKYKRDLIRLSIFGQLFTVLAYSRKALLKLMSTGSSRLSPIPPPPGVDCVTEMIYVLLQGLPDD